MKYIEILNSIFLCLTKTQKEEVCGMNTMHFKYVVEVEKTRSITQAARNLFMAQPNLSKAIRELEETLGFAIFERTPKGVTPTRKGAAFLHYAKNVLVQLEKMEALYAPENSEMQHFDLVMPRAFYLKRVLGSFFATLDPQKVFEIRAEYIPFAETVERVAGRQNRLGIIRYPQRDEARVQALLADQGLRSDVIWSFPYLLTFSEEHPLADCERITSKQLTPFLCLRGGEKDFSDPKEGEGSLLPIGDESDVRLPDDQLFGMILQTVPGSYLWAAPLSEEELAGSGLVQRLCNDQEELWRDLLIYPKGLRFSETESRFIDCLYGMKRKMAYPVLW